MGIDIGGGKTVVRGLGMGVGTGGNIGPPGGGGGDSHMKRSGMLVVPLRGQHLGFWYRLGC